MAKKGKENITIQRRPEETRTGDRAPGEVAGVLRRCLVWPRASSEQADRGTVTIEGYNVWAPAPIAFEISSDDVVVVRGHEHEIEGVPGDWQKRGKMLGLLFQTKRYGT